MSVTRRGLLIGGTITVLGGGVFAAQWFNINASNGKDALAPDEAMALAQSGKITLVDIRRPDEWKRTGVGQGAVPIDMRRKDFIDVLLTHVSNTDAPVALICARGVRSRKMSQRLAAAGFSNIIDVPEGMLGSGAGPGWLKRGLPVVQPS